MNNKELYEEGRGLSDPSFFERVNAVTPGYALLDQLVRRIKSLEDRVKVLEEDNIELRRTY